MLVGNVAWSLEQIAGDLVDQGLPLGSATYGIVYGMERTTVYLTERQKRALERSAKAEGRSEADLIREGVDIVTSRLQAAEARLPLFESGQPDLASLVDEELAEFGE